MTTTAPNPKPAASRSTMHTVDLGNNESVSTGYSFYGEQGYLAMTNVESKWLKTERGAIAWLARRGYDATGRKTAAGR